MIRYYVKASITLIYLSIIISMPCFAAGVGNDANPSGLSTTFTAFYSSTPTIVKEVTPYGGLVCSINGSNDSFIRATAKWRNANIAGTINAGGYTYHIQRTNIPGIGVILRLGAYYSGANIAKALYPIDAIYKTITEGDAKGATNVYLGHKYWALVTIPGESLIPGKYTLDQSHTMVDVWCHSMTGENDAHGGGYASGTVVINSPTCDFGSDMSSVTTLDLGQHQWTDIRNLAVGSNFGSVSKVLRMNCQSGAWPKVVVSDKNDSSNHSTVIGLTNPNDESTAKGVGVQLFLNNQATAQQLATQINLTPSKLTSTQTIDLPLEFKYIKTSSTVSTGQANAIVDLTFTYN